MNYKIGLPSFPSRQPYPERMTRPRKDGRLRMDTDIRIPVTSEQKKLLQEATRDEPAGMAAWARSLLLSAARKQILKKHLPGGEASQGSAGVKSQ